MMALFSFVPFRCQLCGRRFRTWARRRLSPSQRNFERVPVRYPVWFQARSSSRAGETFQGMVENLSIRGCRIRSNISFPIGTRVQLEFLPSTHTFPITVDGAVVRSRTDDLLGLRFVALLREEERRIRHIVNLKLPDPAH